MSDLESTSQSLDSSVNSSLERQKVQEYVGDDNGVGLIKTCSRILTRTATITQAIQDDNEYIVAEDARKIYPSTEPAINENDQKVEAYLEKTQTNLSAIYSGEFNKQDIIDRPPDGGFWAWTCAVSVMLINTFSWGGNSSYGVLLNFYKSSNHFPDANTEEYALIGGLNLGLSLMVCSVANMLVRRFNYRIIMGCGTALLVVSYVCAAECKTIVQLIIVQGLLLSISYALTAGPSQVMIPTWFLKKRSLAGGMAAGGAGLAGIIFSRSAQAVIDGPGYKWALRMIGIVCGGMLCITIFTMRPRRDIVVVTKQPFYKDILQIFCSKKLYTSKAMQSLIVWNFLYGFAYAILLFSFSSFSTAIGLTSAQGAMVTTVQSIAQMVGRPLTGFISMYAGTSNSTIVITILIGVLSMVWWPFITTYGNLIVWAFIAGLFQGVNWVNYTPFCSEVVGGGDDLLAALSTLNLTGGAPLIVAEIIGLKLERSGSKPFLWCQILVGVTALVSAVTLVPFREFKVRRMFEARQHLIDRQDPKERSPADVERLARYNYLLGTTWTCYWLRALYPVKA